jgi:Tol biopolymer transport system component
MATSDPRLAIQHPRRRARSVPLLGAALLALASAARAQLPRTSRVSVDSAGAQANGGSNAGGISADARFVTFSSNATNLVTGDTNVHLDVFVHDRITHVTECESVDPTGATGNGDSSVFTIPTISDDGRYVLFESDATNLTGGNVPSGQLYLRDRSTATTEVVTMGLGGNAGDGVSDFGTITSDGSLVAFSSVADNLVWGDSNLVEDIFLRDRVAGTTTRISLSPKGFQANLPSTLPRITPDGRFVVFWSYASNLVSGDTNATTDVFVDDVAAGTIERISVDSSGAEGNGWSMVGAISADGRYVAFVSVASNLVSGDTNNGSDIFVHDRTTGGTERISIDSSGGEANGDSSVPSISSDGRYVAFQSSATNLVSGDKNRREDVFVHDRSTGTTTRVSVDSNGTEANKESHGPKISGNGAVVAFQSFADNLVSGDTNKQADIFVNDADFAAWTNYGAGIPGTNGVPTFTSSGDPTLGTSITLDLANSLAQPTIGLLFAGVQRATLHTNRGGDLLLLPLLAVPITFSYSGDQFPWSIPADGTLAGLTIDLQAVEADAGAAKGVSFTAGLELAVGF